MDELLRGNYPIVQPESTQAPERSLEDEFERAALKRLGGSITYVARRKVVWNDESAERDDERK
jgi:hypothetical protein